MFWVIDQSSLKAFYKLGAAHCKAQLNSCVYECVYTYTCMCANLLWEGFFFSFAESTVIDLVFTVFSFIDCGHCTTMPKLCAHLCHCVWCAINPRMGRFNAVWYDLASSPTLVFPFMPIVGLCVPKLTVLQTTDGKDKMLMGTGWNCVWQSWFLQIEIIITFCTT